MGLIKKYEVEDFEYCVVEYDCDEDGPYSSGLVFATLEEAIQYMDDSCCRFRLYKLEKIEL